MTIYHNVLEMIGNTPMIEFTHLDTGPCTLYAKLELANPGASVKDRIALTMIEEAEKRGELKPGDTIIESTAGNTGLGLALVAQQKGYKLVLVIPDKMSPEKVFNCRAMGAEVILTRSDVAKGHPEYYQDYAKRLADENGWYYINQFGNSDNPLAHERTTGPEILEQIPDVDAVVLGVGSSGTITGLTKFFKEHAPHVEIVLADPEGSILAPYINTGKMVESGGWLVEGIGEDFIPDICDLSGVKAAYSISDAEAFHTVREVLLKEGIQAGSSSGTLFAAALRYCREQKTPKKVVTFACDTGNRYLSKVYNDFWMFDQGFSDRKKSGDLRDLISRPQEDRSTVVVGPKDTLATTHNRLRNHGFSQIPVVDGETYLGVISEADLISAIKRGGFDQPAETAMNPNFPTMEVTEPLEKLMSLLEIETCVAIVDNRSTQAGFHGVITRSDILNHLRKQAG